MNTEKLNAHDGYMQNRYHVAWTVLPCFLQCRKQKFFTNIDSANIIKYILILRRKAMKKGTVSKLSLRITLCLFFSVLTAACIIFAVFAQSQVELKKQRALANLENQGSKAQFMIENTLHKLDTLKVFVQLADGNVEQFVQTAELILEDDRVRNIALAPDGVIRQVYPMEGNESAIGLNLLGEENASRKEAQQAVDTGKMTIAGPYELAQGGEAITGRLPVYLTGDAKEDCWGLVTITLDMDTVLLGIGMDRLWAEEGYAYEFYHYDPNTGEKKMIAAQGEVPEKQAVEVELPILNDVWYLRAIPQAGWFPVSYMVIFGVVCVVMDALACMLVYLLLYIRDEWRERASKDSLTQVYNHRSMEMLGKELMSRFMQQKLAYMMIDLDNFKQINDTLGHHTGDEVLIIAANVLKQSTKSDALVARPGGDEFSVLVSCRNEEEVRHIAETICTNIKRRIEKDGHSVAVSCSVGISIFPDHTDNWRELNIYADQALYTCKKNGKGHYHIYDGSGSHESLQKEVEKR